MPQSKFTSDQYRPIHARTASTAPWMTVGGETYLNFCSNDYLGLSQHPETQAACHQGIDDFGVGATGSQWVCGYTAAHHDLAQALATWLGHEKVALFSSGYMANLGVLQALAHRHDWIFHDRENHASLIDAVRLTQCQHTRYQRTKLDQLKTQLQACQASKRWLITDAVFSMSGAIAPLQALSELAQPDAVGLIVDDAHGIGVLGPQGQGTLAHTQCSPSAVTAHIITFGKAFGTSGAAICGSQSIIDTIEQHARSLAFTTAPPPAIAAATLASLRCIQNHPELNATLHHNLQYIRRHAVPLGLNIKVSETPIIHAPTGASHTALQWAKDLKEHGIWTHPVRTPSVPQHQAGLRITLSALHTETHLDQLLEALHATQPETVLAHSH